MTLLLDLNDCDLGLYDGAEVLYRQPAIALIEADQVTFGVAAQRGMRLKPQQANQVYLTRLNADPLPFTGGGAANHADLVYQHLLSIADLISSDVVVAVPGTLTNDQLGVFLGIATESGITISGFVESAVLMSNSVDLPPDAWHLDLQQTSACLTSLKIDADTQRINVETLSGCGLMSFIDGWVNLIADRFVHETRFDPLHTAATEQQVYDQVDKWARAPQGRSDLTVQIDHNGMTQGVEVSANALQTKLEQRLTGVLEALKPDETVVLSPRCTQLPGLSRLLRNIGVNIKPLEHNAIARGFAQQHKLLINPENLRVIKSLPHTGTLQQPAREVPPATHVLHRNRAYPLVDNPFGLPAEGSAGDSVDKGGNTYQLIVVEP